MFGKLCNLGKKLLGWVANCAMSFQNEGDKGTAERLGFIIKLLRLLLYPSSGCAEPGLTGIGVGWGRCVCNADVDDDLLVREDDMNVWALVGVGIDFDGSLVEVARVGKQTCLFAELLF